MYNPSKFLFFGEKSGIIQTAWQIHTSEVDTMFDISTSSSIDPNKSTRLDPKKKLTGEQKLSTSAPAPATEDKQGQRTSSRIKSQFQVRDTATEHVSSSAADESQPKCPRLQIPLLPPQKMLVGNVLKIR